MVVVTIGEVDRNKLEAVCSSEVSSTLGDLGGVAVG